MYDIVLQGIKYTISLGTEQDLNDIFILVNDSVLRENSIHSAPITWNEHVEWYSKALQDPHVEYYTIKTQNKVEGYLHYKKLPHSMNRIVSLAISETLRGKGLASAILSNIFPKEKTKKLIAVIKKDNAASRRTFQKAGYTLSFETTKANIIFCRYEKIL